MMFNDWIQTEYPTEHILYEGIVYNVVDYSSYVSAIKQKHDFVNLTFVSGHESDTNLDRAEFQIDKVQHIKDVEEFKTVYPEYFI